jgi:N-acetylmuramic acid 6-phosphate (MurNAc-6-P) etherase
MTVRRGTSRSFLLAPLALFLALPVSRPKAAPSTAPEIPEWADADEKAQSAGEVPAGILTLLGLEPSAESVDYVRNKTQFQLHTLLTEQRHPKTWDLGERIQKDTLGGLRMLAAVDDDVRVKLEAMATDTRTLDDAAAAVEAAVLARKKIYIYGCGATGRLAKQMESAFWRPFWRRVRADGKIWPKLEGTLSAAIEDELIGEMTGADRALISSLEGFEDLQLIGCLQLRDRGVLKGDVVFCVTEGGETSSVVGSGLAAHAQWASDPGRDPAAGRKNLYFVYNNPDERLLPFQRSRQVLEEPGITKINLTTGPQAIAGSTRMQAATIETYVVGAVLEAASGKVLRRFLSPGEMSGLGFPKTIEIGTKLREFGATLGAVRAALPDLARLTDIEARTYGAGRFSTYFAEKGLITVFIDSTERSPTFRLFPLDTVNEPARKCWIQVWTGTETLRDAWRAFLGRPFRGLEPEFYRIPFETEIDDPYLRRSALESLKKAGDDQQDLYDFSMSPLNVARRGPKPGDLGVMVGFTPEEPEFGRPGSPFRRFMDLFTGDGLNLAAVLVTDKGPAEAAKAAEEVRRAYRGRKESLVVIAVRVPTAGDPFGVKQQLAAKMILNAHSTAVMAKLGKVVGNTMTSVSPSNLKLVGRATYLIQSHVNDILGQASWVKAYGRRNPISYGEANAVLYDSIAYLKDRQKEAGQTAEVALSIIRILESLKERRGIPPDEAFRIVRSVGLSAFLASVRGG